jgi:two-component system, chemotaxis family, protein-glutamate methylesterase/glutaminase
MIHHPFQRLSSDPTPFEIVGIGASTGGLNALSIVLTALPRDLPVPIVVVQHLSAVFVSKLSGILGQRTEMIVEDAVEGAALEPGVVYLARPGSHLLIAPERTITMTDTVKVQYVRPSIDSLFESLAEVYGRAAIGVVLTGNGRDGTAGLDAIRRAGGFTIVQTPGSSEADSMPTAAIESGAVDLVVPLAEVAPSIQKVLGGRAASRVGTVQDPA